MENKINVAEILKDCPTGMELDCTMFDDVYFDCVDELNIIHCYIQHETHKTSITFNQHGTYNSDIKSKCVIFPKGKTTWEGFVPPCQFKDGDVLFVDCSDDEDDKLYQYIFILSKPEFDGRWDAYCYLDGVGDFYPEETYLTDDEYHPRFATEEEEQKLFDAIKANGYRWNSETKTLENLPKFKVGDRIQSVLVNLGNIYNVIKIEESSYVVNKHNENRNFHIDFKNQDEWELVPNKFDINTLAPFESRVLVRDSDCGEWRGAFWGYLREKRYMKYDTSRGVYRQCIPYNNDTKHLLGTTDDCNEYYKTWK